MPGNSSFMKAIVEDVTLGPRLSTAVTFPNDPIRGQDVHSEVEELFPTDPTQPPAVQPPGLAIQEILTDVFPNSAHDWLL